MKSLRITTGPRDLYTFMKASIRYGPHNRHASCSRKIVLEINIAGGFKSTASHESFSRLEIHHVLIHIKMQDMMPSPTLLTLLASLFID